MTLGEYLKKCRTARALTLDECAELTGVSKSYLWELEADKSIPSLAIAAALALTLKADLEGMALLALRSGVAKGEKEGS